ncbi:MAG: hypothetical protein A3K67_08060 [Euryarchaeota archaeon RBG_16_62_10]|nr:MAG: hypothetical protein A3K67_08060 [Euryarchaeota archaeon RBG_16_62_10]
MANSAVPKSGKPVDPEEDKYRKKLQRILRAPDMRSQGLSGGVSPTGPRRMSEQLKEATLSPKLVNPASVVPQDEGPLFQCTECDMIVRESDPYCPFCGAIFADGPLAPGAEADEPGWERGAERPAAKEPMARPEMFDIFSLLKTRSRSKDMLYQEALKGFAGSARLLEEIEHLISDISSLGTDTTRARRLMGSAWEACRDGDWHLVSTLARQTEEVVSPSIPDLVRAQIAVARERLTEAKAAGTEISPYVLRIKNAMQALHADDPDEALRLTKELMDSLREDSLLWR